MGVVPPFMVAEVNVTEVPGQNGFVDGEIVIPAGKFTIITIIT
jgi:hypothetical protein